MTGGSNGGMMAMVYATQRAERLALRTQKTH